MRMRRKTSDLATGFVTFLVNLKCFLLTGTFICYIGQTHQPLRRHEDSQTGLLERRVFSGILVKFSPEVLSSS
jgi:hypothetical protein